MKALILRLTLLLFVLFLGTTSLNAQNKTIEKPQKKTTTTTTTTTKPRTNTNTNRSSLIKTDTNIQTNSNSTSTFADPQVGSNTKVSEPTGYINGYGYVDLGLSVKWATCNVGASSPSDYGDYYAWGETSTKSEYTYMNNKTYGKSMGNIASNPQYDAARANWGGTWRLPTASEIDELVDKCT